MGRLVLRLVLFALPLGLDTFALSTILGVTPMSSRTRLRLALTFAAAEGLMPAVGLLLGLPLGRAIGGWSAYVAGALLCAVGLGLWIKERAERDDDDDDDDEAARIASAATKAGWGVLGLALAVSLDELAVGFSFGVLGFPLVPALGMLAGQSLLASVVGQWVGMRAGKRLGDRAEQLSGPALVVLGLWFLAAQVFALPV